MVWVPTSILTVRRCSGGGGSIQPKIDLGKAPARLLARLGLGLDLGLRRLGLGSPGLETGRPPASQLVQLCLIWLLVCWEEGIISKAWNRPMAPCSSGHS